MALDTEEKIAKARAAWDKTYKNNPEKVGKFDEWLETQKKAQQDFSWKNILEAVTGLAVFGLIGYIFVHEIFQGSDPRREVQIRARAEVRAMLKDQDSAEFSGESGYEYSPGEWSACGKVNARNSFGGYVGMTPYIFFGNMAIIRDRYTTAKTWDQLVGKFCRDGVG